MEPVAELVALRLEVALVLVVRRHFDGHLFDHLEAERLDAGDLARVVREDPDRREPRSARICEPIPYSRRSGGKPSSRFASTVSSPFSCSSYASFSGDRCRDLPASCREGRRTPPRRSVPEPGRAARRRSQRSEWKTSPVRHSEWTRTSTSSAPSTCPFTSAMWCLPVRSSRNATAENSPYEVGSRTVVVRSTSFSVRRRTRSGRRR